jgi:hypothetical protein
MPVGLSASQTDSILQSKNSTVRAAMEADVSTLLGISSSDVAVRGEVTRLPDGSIEATFDVYDRNTNVGDVKLLTAATNSSVAATSFSQTMPIFQAAAPLGTTVSLSVVRSAALNQAGTAGDSKNGCFVAGNCAASVAIIVLIVAAVIAFIWYRVRKSRGDSYKSRIGSSNVSFVPDVSTGQFIDREFVSGDAEDDLLGALDGNLNRHTQFHMDNFTDSREMISSPKNAQQSQHEKTRTDNFFDSLWEIDEVEYGNL